MKQRMTLVWILAAAMMAMGCADAPAGGTAPITTAAPLSDAWTLSRVDEWGLPMSIEVQPGVTRQILAGRMTVQNDWTWTYRFDHHDTGSGVDLQGSEGVTGSYTVWTGEPTVLTLRELHSTASHTATLADDRTLTVVMGGHRYVFTHE